MWPLKVFYVNNVTEEKKIEKLKTREEEEEMKKKNIMNSRNLLKKSTYGKKTVKLQQVFNQLICYTFNHSIL